LTFIREEKRAAMISQSCDIKEFIAAIKDKDFLEVIYLADKEATEVERLELRQRAATATGSKACSLYADRLKAFIRFIRYGVRSHWLEGRDLDRLQAIRETLLAKDGLAPDPEESHLAS
jgi:hypothetical protein